MLKRYVIWANLMQLDLRGLAAFAPMNSGDSDPRLCYITAGTCLGRTSKNFSKAAKYGELSRAENRPSLPLVPSGA